MKAEPLTQLLPYSPKNDATACERVLFYTNRHIYCMNMMWGMFCLARTLYCIYKVSQILSFWYKTLLTLPKILQRYIYLVQKQTFWSVGNWILQSLFILEFLLLSDEHFCGSWKLLFPAVSFELKEYPMQFIVNLDIYLTNLTQHLRILDWQLLFMISLISSQGYSLATTAAKILLVNNLVIIL